MSVGEFYSFNVSSVADGGAYYCEARNDLGTQASSEIHLQIEGKTTSILCRIVDEIQVLYCSVYGPSS